MVKWSMHAKTQELKITIKLYFILLICFTTDLFPVRGGVRQGDPLSPLLFILALETLACQIREDNGIRGILVEEEEIKLTLFAADMTCFLRDMAS